MAYVALYRKWRPASFDDVKGQDAVVATLKNQITGGRIAHAYLFCGSRGTGKTSVAKIFAKAVNCENQRDGSPCGVCETCRGIEEGRSTCVVEIDAASNNGVDDIREIRDEVAYRPSDGKYRVYIIDEVHMLSASAFNALLKTLEEPPEYVIFILATTEPHKVPATVLSRCQRYDFHRISRDDIAARLKELAAGEGIEAEDKVFSYIARKADGALRDAISLFDQSASSSTHRPLTYADVLKAIGTVDSELLSRFLTAILLDDTTGALSVIEEVRNEGRDLGQFVQDFIWYLRNLLLLMTADAPAELLEMSEEDWGRLAGEAKMTTPDELMRLIRQFSALSNEMRNAADKRILLEVAAIRASRPETGKSPEDLLTRLSALERRLGKIESGNYRPGTQTNIPEKTEKDKPEEPVREVRITPAAWEDLQKIKGDWKKILSGLPRQFSFYLEKGWLEPKDGGVMSLVLPQMTDVNLARRLGAVEALSELVAEHYKKTIHFDVRASLMQEKEPVFISDEELSGFAMDIETED